MLKHQSQVPVRPSRVEILGANGFVSRHLQSWCARNEVAFRAVASREIDMTRREKAQELAGLLRPDDAVVMTSDSRESPSKPAPNVALDSAVIRAVLE